MKEWPRARPEDHVARKGAPARIDRCRTRTVGLLRGSRLEGWKFRRQSGVAGYVVDFVCHDPKLVVEVDRPVHDEPEQAEFDKRRIAEIEAEGFAVLRLDEAMIRREPGQAMIVIKYVGRRLLQGLSAIPEDDD